MEMSVQLHAPVALRLGKDYGTRWIGGWVGCRAGLDAVAKKKYLILPAIEPRSFSS